jgi:hypothetical protein
MVWIDITLWCDGCGVEILWPPVMFEFKHYCCQECQEGRECDCIYQQEMEDQRRESQNASPSMILF